MKKLLLLLCSAILYANTLVVDANPRNGRSCLDTQDYYTKIQDALDDASSGDIIKICPGTYKECLSWNLRNLTLEGTTENRSDVLIQKKNNSTPLLELDKYVFKAIIRNLSLESDDIAIYVAKVPNTVEIDNVAINSKYENIKADNRAIRNLIIRNSHFKTTDDTSIYYDRDSNGKIVIEHSTIDAHVMCTDLNDLDDGLFVQDSNLSAENDICFYIDGETDDIDINSSSITSYYEPLKVANTVNGKLTINASDLNSTNDIGITLKDDIDGGIEINESIVVSQGLGINIIGDIKKDFVIGDSRLSSTQNTVSIKGSIDGQVLIQKSEINSSEAKGIVFAKDNKDHIAIIQSTLHTKDDTLKIYKIVNNGLEICDSTLISTDQETCHIDKSIKGAIGVQNSVLLSRMEGFRVRDVVDGNITFTNVEVHSSAQKGIKLEKDIKQLLTLSAITVDSEKSALFVGGKAQGGIVIEDSSLSSGAEHGIEIHNDIEGDIEDIYDLYIKDSYVVGYKKALILDDYGNEIDADVKINNCFFLSQNEKTVYLHLDSDHSVLVRDSCFYFTGDDAITFYLDMEDGDDVHINNNCFFGASVDKLAASTESGYDWDGNYWDGLDSTIYEYNNVKDDSPLSICQSSCGAVQQEEKSYRFDAWDVFRAINDRNISTKIVNKEFNLTVAALDENGSDYQEFNGTVCVTIAQGDVNITNWQKRLFGDVNTSAQTDDGDLHFRIPLAVRNAHVLITWKKNEDISCPIDNDDNETNASDHFAIRPMRFTIDTSTQWRAGSVATLYFHALDVIQNNTNEYNEIIGTSFDLNITSLKASCVEGIFDPDITQGWSFADGKYSVTTHYNEVNELNVTIAEKATCTQRFARIDCDDKNISGKWDTNDTAIEANTTIIRIIPHHFAIKVKVRDFDTKGDFTYLSQDLNHSAQIEFNITAQNEQNETTENFIKECYATDVNISLSHTPVPSELLHSLLYILNDANDTNDTNSPKIINKNDPFEIEYNETNFSTANKLVDQNGTTMLRLYFNFDRNQSKPVAPFVFTLIDINVTNSEATSEGYEDIGGDTTFYYARLKTNDLDTERIEDSVRLPILFFDNDPSDSVGASLDANQTLIDWYVMKKHQEKDGIIDRALPKSGFDLGSQNLTNLTIATSFEDGNGTYKVDISNDKDNPVKSAYIHLDIPSWLWYSYSDINYSFDSSSDCTQHPCIHYRYIGQKGNIVKSGETSGVHFEQNISNEKRGVRIFR